jgi:hypothetical protein
MLINKLRIDSQMFHLEPDEDIDDLKQRILEISNGISAFVVFRPVGLSTVSVLVTPNTPVRFEQHEGPDEGDSQWADDQFPDISFDFGLDAA